MMASEQFLVSWNNFHKNMNSGMNSLLENEDFVDVTLAVEGRHLKAHKMVLSVCSLYFRELFKTSPCKHPIVFMKDITYVVMSDLLQFMYKGEVQVSEKNFTTFIKTAEALQIRGLSNHGNGSADCGFESEQKMTELMESEAPTETAIPTPKKLRVSDYTAPIHHEMIKSEVETPAASSSFGSDLISLKTESYDEEQSSVGVGDDDSNENFFDHDPNSFRNDNDWLMEGDEVNTKNETFTEEETITGDLDDYVGSASSSQIPEKSKKNYEHSFLIFERWCNENSVNDLNEKVLIEYFKEKAEKHKPSSLMVYYSILKSMLSIKKNLDISKYQNLLLFLKKTSQGHSAKKSLTLNREHFERFLREASDDIFLLKKVVLIIGVAGACKREELLGLRIEHVIDEGNIIRVQVPDSNNKISKEFIVTSGNIPNVNLIEIIRKYISLRPLEVDHQRFFVSYRQGKCTKQPVGINTFGSIPKSIAQFLGLENPEQYTGHCFRKTSTLFKVVPPTPNFR